MEGTVFAYGPESDTKLLSYSGYHSDTGSNVNTESDTNTGSNVNIRPDSGSNARLDPESDAGNNANTRSNAMNREGEAVSVGFGKAASSEEQRNGSHCSIRPNSNLHDVKGKIVRNAGWVNVGIDHDTAAFAVESIRRWWNQVGQHQYPEAKRLLYLIIYSSSNP